MEHCQGNEQDRSNIDEGVTPTKPGVSVIGRKRRYPEDDSRDEDASVMAAELRARSADSNNAVFRDGIGMGDSVKKKETFLLTVAGDSFQQKNLYKWMEGKPYLKELLTGEEYIDITGEESIDITGDAIDENVMDPDDRKILAAISDPQTPENFRELLQQQYQKAQQEAQKRRLIIKLHDIQTATMQIERQLLMLSGLGQAEGSLCSTTTSGTSSKLQNCSWESRLPMPVADTSIILSPVLGNAESIDAIFPGIAEMGKTRDSTKAEERLKRLAAGFDSYISKCKVFQKSKKSSCVEEIANSIATMKEFMQNCIFAEDSKPRVLHQSRGSSARS